MKGIIYLAGALILLASSISAEEQKEKIVFQEIIDDMEVKSDKMRQHPLLDFLRDESIPPRRRLQFAPYLTYLVMSFSDIVDTWLYYENPQNDLEERVNVYINEDDFHYNLILHDIEHLGYTLDRYGTYTAVMRHVWGDDSRAVRQYIYAWLDVLNRYKDPIMALTAFEAYEIGAQPFIDAAYYHIYEVVDKDSDMKDLLYFGQIHVDLEMNHTQFNWFNDEVVPIAPLGDIEITAQQRDRALEASEEMFQRYGRCTCHSIIMMSYIMCPLFFFCHRTIDMYDALQKLALAEDSIRPEKYQIEGYPPIHAFPPEHPNKRQPVVKDEL